ncbi:hypothetical protein MXB_2239 [Myxobolus squamalis]|nr:hypothetical protein MXB_2239 [Myxobolus squamalis]
MALRDFVYFLRRTCFMKENDHQNSKSVPVNSENGTVIVYKRRFLVLFILAASLFCNGEAWMTFGSVSSKSELYFNKSTSDIELFGTIFLIGYAVVALPCTFMPKVIGLKWTLISGCVRQLWCQLSGLETMRGQ